MILLEIKHANADISSDDFRKQFNALRDECAAEIKKVSGGKYTPNLGAKFKDGVDYDGIVFLHYAPMSCKDYECDDNDDHNKMNPKNPCLRFIWSMLANSLVKEATKKWLGLKETSIDIVDMIPIVCDKGEVTKLTDNFTKEAI